MELVAIDRMAIYPPDPYRIEIWKVSLRKQVYYQSLTMTQDNQINIKAFMKQ